MVGVEVVEEVAVEDTVEVMSVLSCLCNQSSCCVGRSNFYLLQLSHK